MLNLRAAVASRRDVHGMAPCHERVIGGYVEQGVPVRTYSPDGLGPPEEDPDAAGSIDDGTRIPDG